MGRILLLFFGYAALGFMAVALFLIGMRFPYLGIGVALVTAFFVLRRA